MTMGMYSLSHGEGHRNGKAPPSMIYAMREIQEASGLSNESAHSNLRGI